MVYPLTVQFPDDSNGFALATATSGVWRRTTTGSGGDDGDYIEWTVSVPAGDWKLKVLYTSGNSQGKCDLAVDGGAVVDTLDQYTGGVTQYDRLWTSAEFSLTEGSHTIRLTKNGKNASSSSYTIRFSHVQLEKQDVGAELTTLDNLLNSNHLPYMLPTSNTNWSSVTASLNYEFGTTFGSTAVQNDSVTYSFWAPEGAFELQFYYRRTTSTGIFHVYVDGVSIGTVDSYDGTTSYNVLDTSLGGTLDTTGLHTLEFKMETKNASSLGYLGSISGIWIRMTSVTGSWSGTETVAPEVHVFWPQFAEANTNWSTYNYTTGAQGHNFYLLSNLAQNAEITLSSKVILRPGTYSFYLLHRKNPNDGKAHLVIDGVDVGNIDQYVSGSSQYNFLGTITGITLAGNDPHTVKLVMSDKNASSSNYGGSITVAQLVRTGA